MPEDIPQPAPHFEAPAPLESDIDRLAGEISKHKENPEFQGAGSEELIKQAIRSVGPVPQAQKPSDPNAQYLPNYTSDAPAASKEEIEHLLATAFKEGIQKANSLAANSSPFVLDAFHDALTGKLYPELKKRKIVD